MVIAPESRFYETVPKKYDEKQILLSLKNKYDLKIIREQKKKELAELRKELYRLSVKINELESSIDKELIKILK